MYKKKIATYIVLYVSDHSWIYAYIVSNWNYVCIPVWHSIEYVYIRFQSKSVMYIRPIMCS